MKLTRLFIIAAVTAVASTALFCPLTASAAVYKVMYADTQGWGAASTLVHVWNAQNKPFKEWDLNDHMEQTGLYLSIDGFFHPLYEYSFEWDGEPSGILFHKAASSIQTGDLAFSDGAVYLFVAKGDSADPIVADPVIVDESKLPKKRVYFADTGRWGADNTKVHIWGSSGDMTPFQSDPSMTPTGKYALVNDVWAEVYTLEYLYKGTVQGLMFHNGGIHFTADYTETEGALYTYTGNKKPAPVFATPELVDEIPAVARPATLYVNLGANQMMRQGLWQEPCAHVCRLDNQGATDYEAQLPEYGSEAYKAEVMTKVRDGFYRIDIPDISQCNDVIFYYSKVNSQGEHTYKDLAFPASRGAYNDPSTWATFIYDIGIDCVHQSYLTPEEYNAGWEESPSALYLTGNQLVTGKPTDDPATSVRIESDDDVYLHKFSIAAGDVATFKLSRFNARDAAERHGFSLDAKTYESQRGWATFNLGIIGFQNDGDPDWESKYIYTQGNGQSRQVKLWLNESVNFNSYTQYPWRLGDGEGGVAEGDYWLVIDLHEADHSLSLLEFDPNPTVSMTGTSFSVYDGGYDALGAYGQDAPLSASTANGEVRFDRVNVIYGNGTAAGQDHDYLTSLDYAVDYTLMLNGTPVASYETLPESLTVPFMAPGEEADIAIRAKYTDIQTNHTFCSRVAHAPLTAPLPELAAPNTVSADGDMFLYLATPNDAESMTITVGGAAKLPYSLESETDYAFYPDFTVGSVSSDIPGETVSSTIVSDQHFVAARNEFADYLGKQAGTPWTSWTDGAEYGDIHNWSKYIVAEGRLPLFLDCLGTVGEIDTPVSAEATVDLHAVYPFLVISSAQPARGTRAGSDVAVDAFPGIEGNLNVKTLKASTPASLVFSGRTISGVESVVSDTAGDDSEIWHTVSGIRLDREPEQPGLYLVTKGSVTTKRVVR